MAETSYIIDTDYSTYFAFLGLAPSKFNYETLTEALRILLEKEDSKLIAINKSR